MPHPPLPLFLLLLRSHALKTYSLHEICRVGESGALRTANSIDSWPYRLAAAAASPRVRRQTPTYRLAASVEAAAIVAELLPCSLVPATLPVTATVNASALGRIRRGPIC